MPTVVSQRLSREDEPAQVPNHRLLQVRGPARDQPQEWAGTGWAGTAAKGRFPSSLPAVLGQGGRKPGPGARSPPYLSRAPPSPRTATAAAAHMAPRCAAPPPAALRPRVPRSGAQTFRRVPYAALPPRRHRPAPPGRGRPAAL